MFEYEIKPVISIVDEKAKIALNPVGVSWFKDESAGAFGSLSANLFVIWKI